MGGRSYRFAADLLDLLPYTFVIAGVQKAGTTSLSSLLDRHPQVCKAPSKEVHYFDQVDRDWQHADFADYRAPRRHRRQRMLGDATPTYLWWPQALERIHRANPDMRMLAIFRDPVERLFSQWVMTVHRWPRAATDWPKFLTEFRPAGLEDEVPDVNVHAYRMRSGVVRGYYGAQLARGYAIFGSDQWLVLEFRDFVTGHERTLDRVTDFLGLPRYRTHPPLPHGMPGRPTAAGTAPTADDVGDLVETYREDLELFADLSGLDIRHWPTWQVAHGSLEPAALAERLAARVVPPGPRQPA